MGVGVRIRDQELGTNLILKDSGWGKGEAFHDGFVTPVHLTCLVISARLLAVLMSRPDSTRLDSSRLVSVSVLTCLVYCTEALQKLAKMNLYT